MKTQPPSYEIYSHSEAFWVEIIAQNELLVSFQLTTLSIGFYFK